MITALAPGGYFNRPHWAGSHLDRDSDGQIDRDVPDRADSVDLANSVSSTLHVEQTLCHNGGFVNEKTSVQWIYACGITRSNRHHCLADLHSVAVVGAGPRAIAHDQVPGALFAPARLTLYNHPNFAD